MNVTAIAPKIESLRDTIKEIFPDATVDIDWPESPLGAHFIDIRRGSRHMVVEWRPMQGFGLTSPAGMETAVYGEGAEEVTTEEETVINRVKSWLA